VAREALAAWHFAPGAIGRLIPPWQPVRVLRNDPLGNGSVTELQLGSPLGLRWTALHEAVDRASGFTDRSLRGPFAHWVHRHDFIGDLPQHSTLRDTVDFSPPFALGSIAPSALLTAPLRRMFAFRHRRTQHDLAWHARFASGPRRVVAISGSNGAVGNALSAFLTTAGHRVIRLVRGTASGSDEVRWNPNGGWDADALSGIDAVVHLAGENIAAGRWTAQRKERIQSSRVNGTHSLCSAIAALSTPPKALICASAIGLYGNRSGPAVDESAARGDGFLADVTAAWEAASAPAAKRGIRTVNLRIGIVLQARSGVLGKLLLPFLLGAGGRVGSGEQGISWIHIDDLLRAVHWIIETPSMHGPVNAVTPSPVRQIDFARTLARVLRRPCIAPLPAGIVRLLFGSMGDELLLGGSWVNPAALTASGYPFLFSDLESALRFELGRLEC
jgi:uncharacterized protein (TIGR01777 family)